MSPTHLHLLLSHFPVAGSLMGTMILSWGIITRNTTVIKTGMVVFIFVSVSAIPVYLTGSDAEEALDSIGQKSSFYIERHEELATRAFWLCEITGASCLLSIFFSRFLKRKTSIHLLILILSIIDVYLIVQTANAGGQIRHTEIRSIPKDGFPVIHD